MYWSKGTGDDGSNTNGNSYIMYFCIFSIWVLVLSYTFILLQLWRHLKYLYDVKEAEFFKYAVKS